MLKNQAGGTFLNQMSLIIYGRGKIGQRRFERAISKAKKRYSEGS